MSEAIAGVGTIFQKWENNTWNTIDEIISIVGPGTLKDVIDVTSLDSTGGFRVYKTSFKKEGVITLKMNYIRGNYDYFKNAFQANDFVQYRMLFTDISMSVFSFEAMVLELPLTIPADDKISMDVTLQITGKVIVYSNDEFPNYDELVQWLFASNRTQALDGEIIDYSSNVKNATVWQHCYSDDMTYQAALTNDITIDWLTDGLKAEFICSLDIAATNQVFALKGHVGYGIRITTTGFTVDGKQSDGTTIVTLDFSTITTAATDTFYRYKIEVSGANIIVYKTTPDDVNYLSAISQSVAKGLIYSSIFGQLRAYGRWAYLNLNGQKFSFGEGYGVKHYSYNSVNKISLNLTVPHFVKYQNVYLHNLLYGYDIIYNSDGYACAISRNEAGESNLTALASLIPTNYATETYGTKFFRGFGIKLDSALLPYDQNNTFFDGSGNAKFITSDQIPSSLNRRIFFTHLDNDNCLIYLADQNISRPINTANKKLLTVGDSTALANVHYGPILSLKRGLVNTYSGYSGKRLSDEVITLLQADVAITPTLISDKDFIILEGGFNDYGQDITLATFTAGVTALFNYLRAQNPTATIICCGLYDYWDVNNNSYAGIPNGGGMYLEDIRTTMQNLANAHANAYYCNWNTAGIVLADTDKLHTYQVSGGLKLANILYNTFLTIY